MTGKACGDDLCGSDNLQGRGKSLYGVVDENGGDIYQLEVSTKVNLAAPPALLS